MCRGQRSPKRSKHLDWGTLWHIVDTSPRWFRVLVVAHVFLLLDLSSLILLRGRRVGFTFHRETSRKRRLSLRIDRGTVEMRNLIPYA
jgi:hypothetical protein